MYRTSVTQGRPRRKITEQVTTVSNGRLVLKSSGKASHRQVMITSGDERREMRLSRVTAAAIREAMVHDRLT